MTLGAMLGMEPLRAQGSMSMLLSVGPASLTPGILEVHNNVPIYQRP